MENPLAKMQTDSVCYRGKRGVTSHNMDVRPKIERTKFGKLMLSQWQGLTESPACSDKVCQMCGFLCESLKV